MRGKQDCKMYLASEKRSTTASHTAFVPSSDIAAIHFLLPSTFFSVYLCLSAITNEGNMEGLRGKQDCKMYLTSEAQSEQGGGVRETLDGSPSYYGCQCGIRQVPALPTDEPIKATATTFRSY